jgi:hypothetical protein
MVPASATNVVAIAAGWGHSLALRADGTVVSWGDNTYGQASVPADATNIVAIAAGWYHSMAVRADGTLLEWGGTNQLVAMTNAPSGITNAIAVDAGEDFNLVLVSSGAPTSSQTNVSLSVNQGGQLFYNAAIQGVRPMSYQWSQNGVVLAGQTNGYLLLGNAQLANSGPYMLAATNQFGLMTNTMVTFNVLPNAATYSAVGAWGSDLDNECDVPAGIINPVAVAAGAFHNLALQGNGTVIAWGGNWGFSYIAHTTNSTSVITNVPASASNVVAIAAGSEHSLALRNDGVVIAWGMNWDLLSLVFGTNDGQTNVPAAATNVAAIGAGWEHSVALCSNGTVIAWGNNDYGQTNAPQYLTDVVAIAAGYYHNLA